MTMLGTDPLVVAVTKIDRAGRRVQATSVEPLDILRRLIALAPDQVVAAIEALEAEVHARQAGWRLVNEHELAALG